MCRISIDLKANVPLGQERLSICHLKTLKVSRLCIFYFNKKLRVISFFFSVVSQVFNTASSHDPSSGNTVNVSSERQFADIVSGQHALPSWYYTSIDAVPKHGTVSLHSHNRWRRQMAFSKTVYSFEVKEDTVPG